MNTHGNGIQKSEKYKSNYDKLETRIKQDLNRWNLVPLSWGRTDTIRMNILPRFLFLFQALPLYVSPTTLRC